MDKSTSTLSHQTTTTTSNNSHCSTIFPSPSLLSAASNSTHVRNGPMKIPVSPLRTERHDPFAEHNNSRDKQRKSNQQSIVLSGNLAMKSSSKSLSAMENSLSGMMENRSVIQGSRKRNRIEKQEQQEEEQQKNESNNDPPIEGGGDQTSESMTNDQRTRMEKVMRALYTVKVSDYDKKLHEVIPGKLYIGAVGSSLNKDALLQHSITHVVAAGFGLTTYFPKLFQYHTIPIKDTAEAGVAMARALPKAVSFISQAINQSNGAVLVHCFAGKSRSATIVTAYLMVTRNWTMVKALDFLRTKRSVVQPNLSFISILLALQSRKNDLKQLSLDFSRRRSEKL
eukprot:g4001.t1